MSSETLDHLLAEEDLPVSDAALGRRLEPLGRESRLVLRGRTDEDLAGLGEEHRRRHPRLAVALDVEHATPCAEAMAATV